jgi:hypothetical protein
MTDEPDFAIPVILEDIERNLVELEWIADRLKGHFKHPAADKYHNAVAALRDAFEALQKNSA